MPILYEKLTGRVPVEHISDCWHIAVPIHHPGTGAFFRILKRTMDVTISALGLLLIAIATPFALAGYCNSLKNGY